jgi:hypothetical protein
MKTHVEHALRDFQRRTEAVKNAAGQRIRVLAQTRNKASSASRL